MGHRDAPKLYPGTKPGQGSLDLNASNPHPARRVPSKAEPKRYNPFQVLPWLALKRAFVFDGQGEAELAFLS